MQPSNPNFSRRRFLQASAVAASAVALASVSGSASNVFASPDTSTLNVASIAPDASNEFRAVADAAFNAMLEAKVPGAAIGVFSKGRSEYASFGVAKTSTQEAVTRSTRFQIGSINKTFTATAVMRLVEAGTLKLDVPLRSYLPNLRLEDEYTANHVTVRHLLTHTSGWWGDRFVDTGDGEDAIARYVDEELPALPQIAPLGKFVNYNKAAFALLGRVVEVVDARPFRDSLQRLVLDPLALSSMTVDSSVVFRNSYALGYGPNRDGVTDEITPLLLPRNFDSVGTLWSDIEDLLTYARFQVGDSTLGADYMLSARARAEMRTPQAALSGMEGASFGLSWLILDSPVGRLYEHDGGTFGQSSLLIFNPENQFALVVLTNSQNGGAIGQAAQSTAIAQYLSGAGGDGPGVSAHESNLEARQLSVAELGHYAGLYRVPSEKVDMSIVDGRLHFKHTKFDLPGQLKASNDSAQPEGPIDFIGEDAAVIGGVENPEQPVSFLRRDDGGVGWLVVGSRLFPKIG